MKVTKIFFRKSYKNEADMAKFKKTYFEIKILQLLATRKEKCSLKYLNAW